MVTRDGEVASTIGLHCRDLFCFKILERKVELSAAISQVSLTKQLNEREVSSILQLVTEES